jgi:hypothetical protein
LRPLPRKATQNSKCSSTGGHGFDKEPFFKMFAENPDITFTRAEHARTNATAYERDEFLNCDVVVLYDMMRGDHRCAKGEVHSLLDKGAGLVASLRWCRIQTGRR